MGRDLFSIDTDIADRVAVGQAKLKADYEFPDGLTGLLKIKLTYIAYCGEDEERKFTKRVVVKNKDRDWELTYEARGEEVSCKLDYKDGRTLSQPSQSDPRELIYFVPNQDEETWSLESSDQQEVAGILFDLKGVAKRALNKIDEQMMRELREHISENPVLAANMPEELHENSHAKRVRQ